MESVVPLIRTPDWDEPPRADCPTPAPAIDHDEHRERGHDAEPPALASLHRNPFPPVLRRKRRNGTHQQGGSRITASERRPGTLPRSGQRPGFGLKSGKWVADTPIVDAAERKEILNRYRDHSRRFEAAAARRSTRRHGSVIPFTPQIQREVGQDPTAREIEVLQLVADGLVNREIGERLFLSEETVKSHVRHLLAKLQARSRAHAVAVGFRRGLIA